MTENGFAHTARSNPEEVQAMTEREKMLAGELYDPGDAELLARWHLAKDLASVYNSLPSADVAGKEREY